MSNCVHPESFDALKMGLPEAYRHYFELHCCRVYYYLLGKTRDKELAKALSENTFIALFKSNLPIPDEDNLLRRLYLIARLSFLLYQSGRWTTDDLLEELTFYFQDDPDIMDDPDVTRNESLLALQSVVLMLAPEKREVAELFFFQALTARAIALRLRMSEQLVKDHLGEAMQKLDGELAGRMFLRPVPALTAEPGGHAA